MKDTLKVTILIIYEIPSPKNRGRVGQERLKTSIYLEDKEKYICRLPGYNRMKIYRGKETIDDRLCNNKIKIIR